MGKDDEAQKRKSEEEEDVAASKKEAGNDDDAEEVQEEEEGVKVSTTAGGGGGDSEKDIVEEAETTTEKQKLSPHERVKLTRLKLTALPAAVAGSVGHPSRSTVNDLLHLQQLPDPRSWHCVFGSSVLTIIWYGVILFTIPVVIIALAVRYRDAINEAQMENDTNATMPEEEDTGGGFFRGGSGG